MLTRRTTANEITHQSPPSPRGALEALLSDEDVAAAALVPIELLAEGGARRGGGGVGGGGGDPLDEARPRDGVSRQGLSRVVNTKSELTY